MLNFRTGFAGLLSIALVSPAFASQDQIQANNKIGLQWMQKTVQVDAKKNGGKLKNTMVSPISAYAALSMLQSGLSGETKTDLLRSMNLENAGAAGLDSANKSLLESLRIQRKGGDIAVDCSNKAPEKKDEQPSYRPQPPVVGIFNSAWGTSVVPSTKKPFAFAPAFAANLKENYSAEVRTDLNFRSPEAVDTINGWAAQKTNCLIPTVVNPDIMKDLVWILMNATYLEASWDMSFYNVTGANAPKFNMVDGRQISVPMISGTEYMNTVANNDYVAVEIPFYTENRDDDLAFFVLMPHDTREFVAQSLNGELFSEKLWNGLLNQLKAEASKSQSTRVALQMPKFNFAYSMLMQKDQPLTKAVDLNFLFEDGMKRAKDFLTLGTPTTMVCIIKQDTKIELDEKGVKAAAVTLIGGVERTSVPARPVPVVIDKPFAFAIGSKSKGALLFVGSVVDPLQK